MFGWHPQENRKWITDTEHTFSWWKSKCLTFHCQRVCRLKKHLDHSGRGLSQICTCSPSDFVFWPLFLVRFSWSFSRRRTGVFVKLFYCSVGFLYMWVSNQQIQTIREKKYCSKKVTCLHRIRVDFSWPQSSAIQNKNYLRGLYNSVGYYYEWFKDNLKYTGASA